MHRQTSFLLVLFLATAAGVTAQDVVPDSRGWPTATPAQEGVDASAFAAIDARIQAGEFGYIDRLVVIKNGKLVINNRYKNDYESISSGRSSQIGCGFGCEDPSWDHQFNYLHPDWHPYHQGRDVHSLQSVTKSVAATIIATAMHNGEIGPVDSPLLPFLADYDLSGVDPRLSDATLEDLLTMRTGIEWHETDRPMNLTNTTIALELSDDWVEFTLAQPMDADPGEKWVYNSGGSQLMSAIVRSATGMTIDKYAEEHLFGPLGITDYHWKTTNAGLPDALGGLYLEALDLAKIGYLYLKDGVWQEERVLPNSWVAAATARQVERPGYGYQWWRPDTDGLEVWAGQGFGGQYLLVFPEFDAVAVINSWNLFGGRHSSIRDAVARAIAGGD